jgi:magnesium transporter
MDVSIYLYDANGKDQEIGLDEVNLRKVGKHQLLWINVLRRDEAVVKKVFEVLQMEDFPLKSVLDAKERPKIDVFENYFRFFIVSVESENFEKIEKIPIDIVVGKNFIVTVHEGEVGYFGEFRDREKGETSIGELDAESFLATLLDLHIVSYFRALEEIDKAVDEMDEKILEKDLDAEKFLSEMVRLRQSVTNLRRWFLPHRDVFYSLSRPDFQQISESDSADNFRQLSEHFEHAFDAIESSRDTVLSLFELYATKSAQLNNDLIQRLTFITLIVGFLGVIAGIFGMNFEADEVFKKENGFWIALIAMLIISVGLTILAKFKKWI